jgi:hypothetical protein
MPTDGILSSCFGVPTWNSQSITDLNYLVRTCSDNSEQVRHYSGLIDEQLLVLSVISRQTLSFYHSKETVEPILIAPVAEAALRIHGQKIAAKEIRLIKKLSGDVIVESSGSDASGVLESNRQRCGGAIRQRHPPDSCLVHRQGSAHPFRR